MQRFVFNRAFMVLTFGAVLVLVAAAAATEYWGISNLNGLIASARHGDPALLDAVEAMHDDILQLRRYEKDVFINLATPDAYHAYRAKWDRMYVNVRYDLVRARAAAPASTQAKLQAVADAIAAYRTSFERTYGLIERGDLTTAQQANAEMRKDSVRGAEVRLADLEHEVRRGPSQFGPVLDAQRWGFALNVLVLIAFASLFLVYARQPPALQQRRSG